MKILLFSVTKKPMERSNEDVENIEVVSSDTSTSQIEEQEVLPQDANESGIVPPPSPSGRIGAIKAQETYVLVIIMPHIS